MKPASLPGAVRAPMPQFIEPKLARACAEAPEGTVWFHEIKFDGYRIQARIAHGKATLTSRNRLDWTGRFRAIAEAVVRLPLTQAIFDGEVVALLPSGASSFQALQTAFREGRSEQLVYYVFDLLYLDGHDLRRVPLEQRKRVLASLLSAGETGGRVRYSDHVEGRGAAFFAECCRLGLEGIVSKRRDRPYISGRGYDWLKVKCVEREEFVIGGFTEPSGTRRGLGALLVGYYETSDAEKAGRVHEGRRRGRGSSERAAGADASRRLIYAGRVGTGFSEAVLDALRRRLDQLEQAERPFAALPQRVPRGTHWVRPELVAQVEFSNWTDEGLLRHPSFQGLREDVPAESVSRPAPASRRAAPITSTWRTFPPA